MQYIITVDGGTSNTRAYLWEGEEGENFRAQNARLMQGSSSPIGVQKTAEDGNNNALRLAVGRMLTELLNAAKLEEENISAVYVSGMLTSNVGLYELPHLTAPALLRDFSDGIYETILDEICREPIRFIPGLKNMNSDQVTLENLTDMDMMRGEETETLALIDELKSDTGMILILPGSHTKVVSVNEKGQITGCLTSMTGELLQLLTVHSIVADAVKRSFLMDGYLSEYLLAGCRACMEAGSFGRGAFLTRLNSTFITKGQRENASFLLGAVLANDIMAIKNSRLTKDMKDAKVLVSGKEPLAGALETLLKRVGGYPQATLYHPKTEGPLSGRGALLIHEDRERNSK